MADEIIRLADLSQPQSYSAVLADCVVLTQSGKILMQRRPQNWGKHAGVLNIFGGHVEDGETVIDGLVRELHEELGAVVSKNDVIFIDAITESWTDHQEIVHVHFWHDRQGTITGCYEAEAEEFDSAEHALSDPKIMDYAAWALRECLKRGYLTHDKQA